MIACNNRIVVLVRTADTLKRFPAMSTMKSNFLFGEKLQDRGGRKASRIKRYGYT